MFIKNIKKRVVAKKLMLIGLMLSFTAIIRPAAAGDIAKNAAKKALLDEVNRYKQNYKNIGDIHIVAVHITHAKELLSKLDKEYAIYYEILKKEIEADAAITRTVNKENLDRLLIDEAGRGKPDAIDRIKLLLQYNANINPNNFNTTPLCFAAQNGHADIVEFLIQNRAIVDLPKYNKTPLYLAAQHGHAPVVECLINYHANVNSQIKLLFDETALYAAANNGHEAVVDCLIKNHADVSLCRGDTTPFFIAAENGHLPVIKCFLKNNVHDTTKDWRGLTPLLTAFEHRHNNVVACLEQAGDKITDLQEALLEAAQNTSALHAANTTIDYLISKRADVNYISKDDYTALYKAVDYWGKRAIKQLVAAGADLNLAGPRGRTPLCHAIDMGYLEALSTLLDAHRSQFIAPFAHAVKRIDTEIKQQKDDTAPCTNPTSSTDSAALNNGNISTLENLPLECLWIIMQNLSPKPIGHFRQTSRTCKSAAEYEYVRQLRATLTLRKQDYEALIAQTLEYATANRETSQGTAIPPETIAILDQATQHDFWQAALEAQPIRTNNEIMSDAQYEESCAERDASHSRCEISDVENREAIPVTRVEIPGTRYEESCAERDAERPRCAIS